MSFEFLTETALVDSQETRGNTNNPAAPQYKAGCRQ